MPYPVEGARKPPGSSGDTNNDIYVARELFWRYEEIYYKRGHQEYIATARRYEDLYLGGGRQWLAEHRFQMETEEGRPCYEVNEIITALNAAAGYQMENRADITFLPRGGRGDERTAKALSKMMKHVTDTMDFQRLETLVFMDGNIMRGRGFLDLRMRYDDNVLGEIGGRSIDPLDGIPDPDAKDIDPDTWTDFTETRWLTQRELEGEYGEDFAKEVVERSHHYTENENFGTDRVYRTGFDEIPPTYAKTRGWMDDEGHQRRYRVIDNQANEWRRSLVAIFPTGDIRLVEGWDRERIGALIQQTGCIVTHRRMRRVRWKVAAPDCVAFNKISPYEHLTVVPYFPIFRRGRTVGIIDNMVSPQEMLNKFISQYAHIVNGSANSGWQGEKDSLADMDDNTLRQFGAKPGLILLRKTGKPAFEKIEPNPVPAGVDKMIEWAHSHLASTSGIDPAISGQPRDGMSGEAITAELYVAQRKLALPLDNLKWFRNLVAKRCLKLIQTYMGNERIIRITEEDDYGVEETKEFAVNVALDEPLQLDDGTLLDAGMVLNDLTAGEYDVAVQSRPANITFGTGQFDRLIEMKKAGIPIPPAAIVMASDLADKGKFAKALREQEGKTDPVTEADVALKLAQARREEAEVVRKDIESIYSAVQTGHLIASIPAAAPLADQVLRSAGFEDKDAAPIVPNVPEGAVPPPDLNTNPLTPPNPGVGLTAGANDAPGNPAPALPPPGNPQ
jgi:hypothetical protein